MTDAPRPSRLDAAKSFVFHIGAVDLGAAIELLSPNVRYSVEGSNALAGHFSGRNEVAGHLCALAERTMGTFNPVKWEDWLLGEHHVAALIQVHMQADGRVFVGRYLFLMKFDADDLISEITVFVENAESADRFFGR
jgi:ketosteroid isomerase-like protein